MSHQKPCGGRYCGGGLRLPLLRFIPVLNNKKLDTLPAAWTKALPELGKDFQYALGVLREGYVYTFNDMRGTWDGYQITHENDKVNFFRFLSDLTDAKVKSKEELAKQSSSNYDMDYYRACPCSEGEDEEDEDTPHGFVSAVGLSIKGTQSELSRLFYTFSDTEWTSAVFTKVMANRAQYMQSVDLSQLVATKGESPVDGVWVKSDQHNYRAYYANPALGNVDGDALATANKQPASEETPPSENEERNPEDVYVTAELPNTVLLEDHIGITMELANLTQQIQGVHLQSLEKDHDQWLCDILPGLEQAIKRSAETSHYDKMMDEKAEALNAYYRNNEEAKQLFRLQMIGGMNSLSSSQHYKTDSALWHTREGIDAAMNAAWAKYKSRIDLNQYQATLDKRAELTKACDDKIAQLDKAIKFSLLSKPVIDYFDTVFDANEYSHGGLYTKVFVKATDNTGDLTECGKLYTKWLTEFESENLMSQAMCCNSQELKNELIKETGSGSLAFVLGQLEWRTAFGVYNTWLSNHSVKEQEMVTKYITKLASNASGAILGLANNQSLSSKAAKPLFAIGLHAQTVVAMSVITNATPQTAARTIMTDFALISAEAEKGKPLSNNQRKQATRGVPNAKNRQGLASELLVRFTARGLAIPPAGPVNGMILTPLDKAINNNINAKLSNSLNASHIVSHDQIKALATNGPVSGLLSVLGLVAYGIFYKSSFDHFAKIDKNSQVWTEFSSATFATLGAIAGTVSKTLEVASAARNMAAAAQGARVRAGGLLSSQVLIRQLSAGGQILGGVGGGLLAILDGVKAYNEITKSTTTNKFMVLLYAGSLITNTFISAVSLRQGYVIIRKGNPAMVRGAKSLGWALVFAIAINLMIAWLEKKQGLDLDSLERWLRDYPFGSNRLDEASKALELMMGESVVEEAVTPVSKAQPGTYEWYRDHGITEQYGID